MSTSALELKNLDRAKVVWIQTQLLAAGLLKPFDVDGVVGDRTLKAFAEFKRKNYLAFPTHYGATSEKLLKEIGEKNRPIPVEALEADIKATEPSKGAYMTLPHGMGKLYLDEPVKGCKHIKWKELTANGTRIPESKVIVRNLIRIALQVEKARGFLGDRPVIITSGYRPPGINRQVGGVPNSRHLLGDAVDVKFQGIPPMEAAKRLNEFWGDFGGIGYHHAFTHLDGRGYKVRFSY